MSLNNLAFASDWSIQADSPEVYQKVLKIIQKNKKNDSETLKSKILKKLKESRFLTARVEISEATKSIQILDATEYLILFSGNLSLSDRKIKNSIDLDSLVSTNETIAEDLIFRIKTAYKNNGYSNAKVKVEKRNYPKKNLIRYLLKIQEGQLFLVGKIKVNGNYSKKEKYYINFLKSKSSNLFTKGKFSKPDFENGLNNLSNHLKNIGFLDASISSLRFEDNKNGKVNISFTLYEGQPTLVNSVTFVGNKNVDSEWLGVLLNFQKDDILDFRKLETNIRLIYEYYLSTGYLEVQINPEEKELVKLNQEKRKADITIYLEESEKIVAGKINISGLTKTKKSIVYKMLDFEIGDVITVEKIQNSKRRLNLSGLFGKTEILFEDKDPLTEARILEVSLDERNPGVIQLGFGTRFNQRAFSVKGYTGLLYKNLGGSARAINSRLELQTRLSDAFYLEHRAFISYYEPFLFDKDIRGRLSVESSESIFQITSSNVTLFRSQGFDFVLENNFNKHIKASWTLFGFDFNKEYQIPTNNNEIRERIGSLGPAIEFDYRNDLFLPTKGFFTSFQAEYAPSLFGTEITADGQTDAVDFVRTEGTFTKYFELNKSLIWVNTMRGGWLRNLSQDTNRFPKSRAFFLGGATTIRGFDPSDGVNERIPSDLDLDPNGVTGGGASGGKILSIAEDSYYYLIKTEVRFPIYQNFWGSLFYDGGSVLIDEISMKDPYRDAAGFGLRFNTPVGAFNIDVGFKLDRDKSRGENPGRIHISIGTF